MKQKQELDSYFKTALNAEKITYEVIVEKLT